MEQLRTHPHQTSDHSHERDPHQSTDRQLCVRAYLETLLNYDQREAQKFPDTPGLVP